MEKTLCVAKALYDMYFEQKGECMDQMKMHKLMYFAQRESLMYDNEAMFDGIFYGWKYGPVLKEVRSEYLIGTFFSNVEGGVLDRTLELLKNVLKRYGSLTSWKLSRLSHDEFSWKKARIGLEPGEDGDVPMLLDAIRIDAARELVARETVYV